MQSYVGLRDHANAHAVRVNYWYPSYLIALHGSLTRLDRFLRTACGWFIGHHLGNLCRSNGFPHGDGIYADVPIRNDAQQFPFVAIIHDGNCSDIVIFHQLCCLLDTICWCAAEEVLAHHFFDFHETLLRSAPFPDERMFASSRRKTATFYANSQDKYRKCLPSRPAVTKVNRAIPPTEKQVAERSQKWRHSS